MSKTFGASSDFPLDSVIIHEEIHEYMKNIQVKEDIITRAAKKLEDSGKYPNPQVIANIIVREFTIAKTTINEDRKKAVKVLSKSYIYSVLDEKYKRDYKKPKDTPVDLIEEVFFRIEDIHKDIAKISSDIIKKCRADEKVKAAVTEAINEFIHSLHEENTTDELKKQLSKVGQIKDLILLLKNSQNDINYIKEIADYREKLEPFMKLRLKMMFLDGSFCGQLATKLKMSSKWMTKVKNDDSMLDILKSIKGCPSCGFNMAEWFKKATYANEHMCEVPEIPKHKTTCDKCNKKIPTLKN